MALPTTNLKIDDVKTALGNASNDLGTLCIASSINMWSKKKPVKYEKTTSSEWWLGTGNDYSLSIPSYNGTDTQLWTYNKPIGGSSSPYNLGHFREYHHTALLPLNIGNEPSGFEKREYTFMPLIATPDGYQVSLEDLTGYGTLLFGCEVYDSGDNLINWASESALGDGIDVDFTNLSTSNLTVKFFLTDTYKAWGSSNVSNTRYALPRATTADNQFWVDIPLSVATNPYINKFTTIWNSLNNVLTNTINTKSYTGTVTVTITKVSNSQQVFTKNYTISTANVDTVFNESNVILEGGTTYESKIFWSGQLRDSYTWMSFATPPPQ